MIIRLFLCLSLLVGVTAEAQEGNDSAARRTAQTRLKVGDKILLHFLRERQLSESLTVSERGDAVFPKLGLLRVDRFTIGELQDTLRVRYGEYMRSPEFEVLVLRRVTVNGEVRIPNV